MLLLGVVGGLLGSSFVTLNAFLVCLCVWGGGIRPFCSVGSSSSEYNMRQALPMTPLWEEI